MASQTRNDFLVLDADTIIGKIDMAAAMLQCSFQNYSKQAREKGNGKPIFFLHPSVFT